MFLLVFPFLWLLESYSTTVYIVYVFEWVKAFHSNFDRLLALLKRLLEKRQPSAYGDELLTDKEVAYLLKVSRRTLQDYRNNGILPYTQVGGKILYRASDIEKTLMKGYKEAYRLNE